MSGHRRNREKIDQTFGADQTIGADSQLHEGCARASSFDEQFFGARECICSSPSRHAEPRLEARLGTSVLWWPMPLVCIGAHSSGECKWGLAELASASNGAIRKWTNLQSFFERKLRILQRLHCWSDGGAR